MGKKKAKKKKKKAKKKTKKHTKNALLRGVLHRVKKHLKRAHRAKLAAGKKSPADVSHKKVKRASKKKKGFKKEFTIPRGAKLKKAMKGKRKGKAVTVKDRYVKSVMAEAFWRHQNDDGQSLRKNVGVDEGTWMPNLPKNLKEMAQKGEAQEHIRKLRMKYMKKSKVSKKGKLPTHFWKKSNPRKAKMLKRFLHKKLSKGKRARMEEKK